MKKRLVVLTGAGVSADSGIATFRDSNGLWENYRVEDVATPEAWVANPQLVLDFYNQRRKNVLDAEPNAAHFTLAALEHDFDVYIITQNVDDLHERAGSTNVLHIHGEIMKMRSETNEHLIYDVTGDTSPDDLATDGSKLRPHIVWFGEAVPLMDEAVALAESADVFVIVGTSLQVYPAAGLLYYVPEQVPVFILDRNIPKVARKGIIAIEKKAAEGAADLQRLLSEYA